MQPVILPKRITVVFLLLAVAALPICYASIVLLVVFAGILFGILLRAPASWLARHTVHSRISLALGRGTEREASLDDCPTGIGPAG